MSRCAGSHLQIVNSEGIKCSGDNACRGSTFVMGSNQCSNQGDNACLCTTITMRGTVDSVQWLVV